MVSVVAQHFKEHYEKKIMPDLMKTLNVKSKMAVPRLEKIVINVCLGRNAQQKDFLSSAKEGLADITGQMPCETFAKKSIAGFKIREGMILGLKVTLRDQRMYDFLKRLIYIAMPRIRDFRGVSSKSFDGRGNFSFGVKEYHIFPEIKYDKVSEIFGIDVTFVTSAKNNEEGRMLLEAFGLPFRS